VRKILGLALILSLASFSLGYAYAAAGKTYQVTCPVVEVRPDAIVVKKGSENWELARNSGTKVTGDLKVGAKVTIQYTMTATEIEVKPAAATATKKKK